MKKHFKPDIWLTDNEGHNYHLKINSNGDAYLVDAIMNKSLFISKPELLVVGSVIDYPLFFNTYTVVKIDNFNV